MALQFTIKRARRRLALAGMFFTAFAIAAQPLYGTIGETIARAVAGPMGQVSVAVYPHSGIPGSTTKEAIQLTNIGTATVSLSGVVVTEIRGQSEETLHVYGNIMLAPGEAYLLCENTDSVCDEEWAGNGERLNNAGDTVRFYLSSVSTDNLLGAVSWNSVVKEAAVSGTIDVPVVAPVTNPQITSLAAVKHDAENYKGIYVELKTTDIVDATAVEVTLKRADNTTVTKKSKPAPSSSITGVNAGLVGAPFIVQHGSYDEAGSGSWHPAPATWSSVTKPVELTAVITLADGATVTEASPVSISQAEYESLLPAETTPPEPVDDMPPSLSVVDAASKKLLTKNDSITVEAVDPSGIRETHANIRAVGEDGRTIDNVVSSHKFDFNREDIKTEVNHIVTLQNLADGKYELRLAASDTLRNSSKQVKHYFTVDSTAPTVPTGLSWKTTSGKVLANSGATNEQSGVAHWQASEDTSGTDHYVYKYWNDIAGNQYKVGKEYKANSNSTSLPGTFNQGPGVHYFAVSACDVLGNCSAYSPAFKVVYDAEAPSVPSITKPTPRQWFKTQPIPTTWTAATDSLAGVGHYQVAYRYDDGHGFGGSTCAGEMIDGKPVYCRDASATSRNHTPGLNEEGGVTVWVRAFDKAGNVGSWSKPVHYYYDYSDPTTTMDVPAGVVGNSFTINGEASDNLALNRAYLQLNKSTGGRFGGVTLHMISNPFSLASSWSHTYDASALGLADGDYRAHAAVTDMAGNSSDTGWSSYFTIDTTKPTVKITSPTVDLTNGNVEVRATVTDENLRHYWYQIKKNGSVVDSQTVLSSGITNELLYTLTEDGEYTITVAARDLAGGTADSGNRSDDVVKTVIVDKTAPIAPIATTTVEDGETVSVALSTDDGTDTIYYTLDGSDPSDAGNASRLEYGGEIELDTDLTQTLRAVAYDRAGNVSPEFSETYNPAPVITNEAAITPTTTSIVIEWTTDHPATSRVVYDTVSRAGLDTSSFPDGSNYGYAFSTVEDTNKTENHSVTVAGLTPGTTYYFRTVSKGSPENVSGEITGVTQKETRKDGTPVYVVSSSPSPVNPTTQRTTTALGNSFFAQTNPIGDSADSDGSRESMLSSSVEDNGDEQKGEVLAATDGQDGCGKFLALCWYWWVPIAVAGIGVVWVYLSARGRRSGKDDLPFQDTPPRRRQQ